MRWHSISSLAGLLHNSGIATDVSGLYSPQALGSGRTGFHRSGTWASHNAAGLRETFKSTGVLDKDKATWAHLACCADGGLGLVSREGLEEQMHGQWPFPARVQPTCSIVLSWLPPPIGSPTPILPKFLRREHQVEGAHLEGRHRTLRDSLAPSRTGPFPQGTGQKPNMSKSLCRSC